MSSVDVVIPCYNYARYLRGCVESVLSQRGVDVRILIIDDKSSDETPTIGQALAAGDPRIEFRRHEANKGLIGTANEGIEWVKAPFMLLLSADDALTPGSLSRALQALEARPDVGMVYGRAHVTADDLPDEAEPDAQAPTVQVIPGEIFLKRSCKEGNPVPSPTAVVRTALLRQTGGYCSSFPHTSDMELWMRIATRAPIAAIREAQGLYRWHGANMAAGHTKGVLQDSRARLETCTYVYETWNGEAVGGFADWLGELKRDFARHYYWLAGELAHEGRADDAKLCLDFAEQCSSRRVRRLQVLKGALKSWLGRAQISQMRKARASILPPSKEKETANWFDDQHMFGWWPETK